MSTLTFGVYICSFEWVGRNQPANYPEGYQYLALYDDEVTPGHPIFHWEGETDALAPVAYQLVPNYGPEIASAYSGPENPNPPASIRVK